MSLTSEDIARHTEEFLARGGVIQEIPFLKTTRPNHPDVLQYIRIRHYGYVMRGAKARNHLGDGVLPDTVHDYFVNNGQSDS